MPRPVCAHLLDRGAHTPIRCAGRLEPVETGGDNLIGWVCALCLRVFRANERGQPIEKGKRR